MQAGMESCPVKTVISGTMGFGLGGAFGLFMASVSIRPFHLTTLQF
jgi:import inner membrane translocase subunit TIM22